MALLKKARGALIVVGILSALGTAALVLRLTFRGRDGGVPDGDTVWNLKCLVKIDAKENAVLHIAIPADTANIRVFGHDFNTPRLRQERTRGRGGLSRDFTAVAYREGRFAAEAEFDLHLSPRTGWRLVNGSREPTPEELMRYLKAESTVQSDDPAVIELLRTLRESKPANRRALLRIIFDYCTQQITADEDSDNEDALSTIKEREGSSLGRARAMLALCRAARIHSRLVTGFILDERRETVPHIWLETYNEKRWEPYDPEFGHIAKLPANFLPIRRGGHEIVRVSGGELAEVNYELQRRPVPRGMFGNDDRSPLQIFDITRLPLVTQLSLATLLLLPFGALLTTFFRNVIGVRTFGTFSPTLLALAAVYAEWKTVIMIFTLVIIFGVGGRALLPGFKLMQVPRLSIVFTLVAVSMMLSVSLLDYFGLNPTGQIALLPMVVLTSLVDRIYSVADDDGMHIAAVRLGWTAAVGVLCFGLFFWKGLGLIMIQFPEIHCFTIAAMLLFGLYKGPKLCDVPTFAFLGEPKSEKAKDEETKTETTGEAGALAESPETPPAATTASNAATAEATTSQTDPAATPPVETDTRREEQRDAPQPS